MYQFKRPKRPISRVFLHCSASDNPAHDNVATMRAWHLANGWSDVGYHLFTRKSGLIDVGRSLELTPAAQAGHNTGTIAICCHGLEVDRFTAEQRSAIVDLCGEIDRAYDGRVTFHGHCEVSAKACPVYDYKGWLGLDAKGRMGRVVQPSTDADEAADITRTLRLGAKGDDVRWMQAMLNRVLLLNRTIPKALIEDGRFGEITEDAVIRFQSAHFLVPDGVYGPLSREAMDEASEAMRREGAL